MNFAVNKRNELVPFTAAKPGKEIQNLLSKFSLAWWILPFLGEWKEWHLIMNLACSKTKKEWINNYHGFRGLHQMVKWRVDKADIEAVFMQKYFSHLELWDNTDLLLISSRAVDVSFMNLTKHMWFPSFNKLEVWKVDQLQNYYQEKFLGFLKSAVRNKINQMVLTCEMHVDLGFMKDHMRHITKNTIKILRLERFKISQDILQLIFESAEELKELGLINWMVSINNDFRIREFSWNNLAIDLRRTCRKNNNDYLNPEKLSILAKGISSVSHSNWISKVHAYNDEFPLDELNKILTDNGISTYVY